VLVVLTSRDTLLTTTVACAAAYLATTKGIMTRRHKIAAVALLGAGYIGLCAAMAGTTKASLPGDRSLESIAAKLPAGFLLGTATSAHQVEGGNDKNDWALFEAEAGRIARGERSGKADDHWNRVAEDVELMKKIGANAYRFSVEWSRVEPSSGFWDDAAWDHYQDEVNRLREAGIVPMVTLLHFTLPAWLAERGGLTAPDFARAFARFAGEAAARFGNSVELYCTLNEPNVAMYNGYVQGIFAPGQKSNSAAVAAFAGMVRAHGAAARAIRARNPNARIGVAMNLILFEPKRWYNLLDVVVTRFANSAFNWAFLDSVAAERVRFRAPGFPSIDEPNPELSGSLDFIGVNYYRRDIVSFAPGQPGLVRNEPGDGERTDLGWEIHPEGLLRVLREAHRRYGRPIYLTENGLADAAGAKRGPFIRDHLAAVSVAVREGIDVRGYFHWSLLDNFEWAEGFEPRFGLYRVDYATLERTAAPGAEVFAELAAAFRRRK
jgi:beta-glucosidase